MTDDGLTLRGDGEAVPLFHTHIVVDWSARSKPSPKVKSKDAIWWAVARIKADIEAEDPEYARTRHEALCRLTRLIAKEMDKRRRVLVGFDFPFGYPAGVAEHVTGEASAMALWDWLDARINDDCKNDNNRYHVAATINGMYPGCGPFWGRHHAWDCPTIPARASERTEQNGRPPEYRVCEKCATGAKTVWQLAYPGAVGSQTLLGLPVLKRLTEDSRVKGRAEIWPFQTGLRTPDARAVIV